MRQLRELLGFVHLGRHDRRCAWHHECGMTTAEYAVGTIAAAGFAGLLIALLSSDEVRELLFNIVRSALAVGG